MDEKVIIQQRPPKSPAAAGILSIILPGLGNLYNGLIKKGLLHLVVFAGILVILIQASMARNPIPIVFMSLMLAGFWFYQIIDSINSAKAINLAACGGEPAGAVKTEPVTQAVQSGSIFWGIVLMAIGVLVTMAHFDVITWEALWDFWPVVVIVFGVKLVYESVARNKNAGDGK
ncbi:MAG: DUF5668 domain-containing protein [Acidobacteriota bacterium]